MLTNLGLKYALRYAGEIRFPICKHRFHRGKVAVPGLFFLTVYTRVPRKHTKETYLLHPPIVLSLLENHGVSNQYAKSWLLYHVPASL